MNAKRNQILIGIIFVLLGLMAFAYSSLGVKIGALTLLGCGAALLLLYKTKRKSWSLGAGCYLLLFGAIYAADSWFNLEGAFLTVVVAGVFFLAPGVFFLALYYDKNKQGLLIPSCLLLWSGLFVFAFCIPGFAEISLSAACIFAGLAFITMRLLGGHFLGNIFAYIGLVIIGIGVFIPFGVPVSITGMIPAAVILFGLFIILRALLNKE